MLNRIIHFSLYNRIVVLILSGLILAGGCIALVRSEIDIFQIGRASCRERV